MVDKAEMSPEIARARERKALMDKHRKTGAGVGQAAPRPRSGATISLGALLDLLDQEGFDLDKKAVLQNFQGGPEPEVKLPARKQSPAAPPESKPQPSGADMTPEEEAEEDRIGRQRWLDRQHPRPKPGAHPKPPRE